jgi:uncharacterized membrane protein YdjX (TVP38/TMEM64 family)
MIKRHHFVWGLWFALLAVVIIVLLLNPELTKPKELSAFISKNEDITLLIFCSGILLKVFTIIPLTPFIVAGAMIYTSNPWITILACWMGGQLTSILHYRFPHWLHIDVWAERKYGRKLEKLKKRIARHSFWYVLVAATIPIMPGELLYYLSGTLRIPFGPYQLAIAIGHLIVISVYTFGIQSAI